MADNYGFLTSLDKSSSQVISESDFAEFTQSWLVAVHGGKNKAELSSGISGYFYQSSPSLDKGLMNIYFNDTSIHHLLSSVGVQKIHARFAIIYPNIIPRITRTTFSIILYAVDSLDNRCSAYYCGDPTYVDISDRKTSGEESFNDSTEGFQNYSNSISDRLAATWLANWKTCILKQGITRSLFNTTYGYLRGYNYSMNDFMNTLYPPNTFIESYDVNINLALHDHFSHVPGQTAEVIETFGLVLSGQPLAADDKIASPIQNDPPAYYDLSLPSPPN